MCTDFDLVLQFIASRASCGPAIIVFADSPYRAVIRNWIGYAQASGVVNIVIIALDEALATEMRESGIACVELPPVGSLEGLWIIRARLFAALCRANVDFIHSDADAIWLRNPVERAFGFDVDISFSQGTVWPSDIAVQWGFVVCCGFFAVRGSLRTSKYFEAVASLTENENDDQIAANRVLDTTGVKWRLPEVRRIRSLNDQVFFTFDEPLFGYSEALTAVLLPHYEFSRMPELPNKVYVAHPLSAKTSISKINMLRQLGLWAFGDIPRTPM